MNKETPKEEARRIQEDVAREEQEPRCPKCGGETGVKTVGDESFDYCFI